MPLSTHKTHSPNTSQAPRGFTIAEMLVVLLFMGVVTTAVMANIRSGNQTEILRQSVQTLIQDIRTVQNYAVGGRKFSICEGTYEIECIETSNCSGVAAQCGGAYPDCIAPMECGDVPEGGYGIAITQNTGYTLYADTYIDEEGMTFAEGQHRWYQSSGSPSDPSSPVRNVLFTDPSVYIYAVQYADQKICAVGPNGPDDLAMFVTFEPPFAAGHVILYEKSGSETYVQNPAQLLKIWVKGKGNSCNLVEVNGVTGRVTDSIVTCPTLDPTCVNA